MRQIQSPERGLDCMVALSLVELEGTLTKMFSGEPLDLVEQVGAGDFKEIALQVSGVSFGKLVIGEVVFLGSNKSSKLSSGFIYYNF